MTDEAFVAHLLSGEADANAAWRQFLQRYSNLFLKVIWQFEQDHDSAMDKYAYVCERFASHDYEVLRRFKAAYGENPPKFTTWLAAVTRNMCVDMHRSVHGRKQLPRSIRRLSHAEQLVFKLYYWNGCSVDEIRERLRPLVSSSDSERNRLIKNVLSMQEDRNRQAHVPGFVPFEEEVMGGSEQDYDTADILSWLEKWLEELPPQERMILRLRFWEDMTGAEIAAAMHISPKERVYPLITKALQNLRRKTEAVKK